MDNNKVKQITKEKYGSKNESMNRALKDNIIKVRDLKEKLSKSNKLVKDFESDTE